MATDLHIRNSKLPDTPSPSNSSSSYTTVTIQLAQTGGGIAEKDNDPLASTDNQDNSNSSNNKELPSRFNDRNPRRDGQSRDFIDFSPPTSPTTYEQHPADASYSSEGRDFNRTSRSGSGSTTQTAVDSNGHGGESYKTDQTEEISSHPANEDESDVDPIGPDPYLPYGGAPYKTASTRQPLTSIPVTTSSPIQGQGASKNESNTRRNRNISKEKSSLSSSNPSRPTSSGEGAKSTNGSTQAEEQSHNSRFGGGGQGRTSPKGSAKTFSISASSPKQQPNVNVPSAIAQQNQSAEQQQIQQQQQPADAGFKFNRTPSPTPGTRTSSLPKLNPDQTTPTTTSTTTSISSRLEKNGVGPTTGSGTTLSTEGSNMDRQYSINNGGPSSSPPSILRKPHSGLNANGNGAGRGIGIQQVKGRHQREGSDGSSSSSHGGGGGIRAVGAGAGAVGGGGGMQLGSGYRAAGLVDHSASSQQQQQQGRQQQQQHQVSTGVQGTTPSGMVGGPIPYSKPSSLYHGGNGIGGGGGGGGGGSQVQMVNNRDAANEVDLSNWAPNFGEPRAGSPDNIPNLPSWNGLNRTAPTSYPISAVQRDLDYSMRRLISEQVFKEFLEDPLSRFRFREYLDNKGVAIVLDQYWDSVVFERALAGLKNGAKSITDVYFTSETAHQIGLHHDIRQDSLMCLDSLVGFESPLAGAQEALLRRLYKHEFQGFIKHKLVEQSRVKLGSFGLSEMERNGLGDCFVLTNPRLRDHPIVMVSDGFAEVTGYSRMSIIGRNCRFLQGPGTSYDAVQRIREALNQAEPITELLLNYRRDGTPFYCLLCMLPLHDSTGQLCYFIGGQANVTGSLTATKNLSFLIGCDPLDGTSHLAASDSASELSPTMERYNRSVQEAKLNNRVNVVKGSAGGFIGSEADVLSAQAQSANQALQGMLNTQNPGMAAAASKTRAFTGSLKSKVVHSTVMGGGGGQLLVGAESVMAGQEAKPIEDQLQYFSDVYSKVLVFEPVKRHIIFAAEPLLNFLGLPTSKPSDVYNHPLLHMDITDLIQLDDDKIRTKSLREIVRSAVKSCAPFSIQCELKTSGGSRLPFAARPRFLAHNTGALHGTPLKDREGKIYA